MYKKILSLIITFTTVGGLFAATEPISERSLLSLKSFDADHSTLQAATPEYTINKVTYSQDQYDFINTSLDGQIRLIGAPDLPTTSTFLAVPPSGDLQTAITYSNVRTESNIDLAPFQPVQLEAEGMTEDFIIDFDIYAQDAWFPQSPVIVHDRVTMRDLTLVTVEVSPFQYNPVRKELRVYEGLEVNLTHSEPLTPPARPISRFFEPIYESMVPNSVLVLEPNYQTPSILYIHPENSTVIQLLDALKQWRHEKGFEVHSASTLQTGSSNSSIKNFIQTAYNTWTNPPEFVVLVGDAGGTFNIPTWIENFSNYNGEGDLPYVHLEGNDYVADAFVGRLPFGSTTEFTNIVSKLLNYEKNPSLFDAAWYTRGLMVGDQASSGLSTIMTNRNIHELSVDHGYSGNFQVYGGSFVSQIASGLNAGVSFFNYRGWLGMSGWGNSNTSSLTNGSKLPFVTILTCGTGSFTGDSRSEQFLRVGTSSVPKGAIAAVGTATSGTHTLYNNCVSVGIYHGIFSDEIYYAGAAVERGRVNLNQTYPSTTSDYVKIFSHWNNLMGDPSTELWTGLPENIQLDVAAQIPDNTHYLDISVLDEFDNPLEGAWVTLTGQGVFVSGYSDMDGNLVLDLPESVATTLKLTATKHNFKPRQVDITVGNTDFAVLVDATSLTETSGNGDGMFNPGETAQFDITFSNHAATSVSDVTVTIKGENAATGVYTYPTMDAGASVTLNNQSFTIPENYPGIAVYDVAIEVEVGATSYTDHRRFDVYAPYIQVNALTEPGLPPHSFDPGEVTNLVINADNIGTLASSNLTAVLRCSDPNLEILDSTALFTDAAPGASTNNAESTFEINIGTQFTVGVQVPIQVEFTDDNGFVERVSLLLPIGTPGPGDPTGPDAGGYFCYDDQDLAYALAPTYDWIEIVPGQGGYMGTLVPLSDNSDNQEDIHTVNLPFEFGFYGEDYNQVSICSNGYIALGSSEVALFRNYPVPGPLGPNPMIAAFWDDLVMGSGDVYTYSNVSEHIFIITYHNMQNAFSNDTERFQIILYDADYYGSTDGNGDIKIQYHTYNNTNTGTSFSSSHGQYSTTGLEDHTGQVGLQYTFNNMWAETAHELTDGSALFFTTRTDAILPCPGWGRGDINNDGYRGVQDLVILINVMLGEGEFGECEFWAADKSLDSLINISDVVLLVDEIMGNSLARPGLTEAGVAEFTVKEDRLLLTASKPAQAFSFTLETISQPLFQNYPGLKIMSRETENGYKVLGYWSGEALQEIEILLSQDANFNISDAQVAGAAGILMKSGISVIPETFEITSVYPNPFNPTVNITYNLPQAEEVSIRIFNALGQEVNSTTGQFQAGEHVYSWNGVDKNNHLVSSGIYFARITTADASQMVKLTYLR